MICCKFLLILLNAVNSWLTDFYSLLIWTFKTGVCSFTCSFCIRSESQTSASSSLFLSLGWKYQSFKACYWHCNGMCRYFFTVGLSLSVLQLLKHTCWNLYPFPQNLKRKSKTSNYINNLSIKVKLSPLIQLSFVQNQTMFRSYTQ